MSPSVNAIPLTEMKNLLLVVPPVDPKCFADGILETSSRGVEF
jgi:hypothetical protein